MTHLLGFRCSYLDETSLGVWPTNGNVWVGHGEKVLILQAAGPQSNADVHVARLKLNITG